MCKKFLRILFVSVLLLFSCTSNQFQSMAGNCSKDGVAEFMQVFGMHAPSIDISGETAPTDYVVYTANIRVLEGNFANLAYTITGAAGSVNSWNGIPVFYPTNS